MAMDAPEMDSEKNSSDVGMDAAVLTEAVRHVDIIHTSLAGMTAIVLVLLFALALPVFGRQPVTQPLAFWVMVATSFIGIVGLYVLNFRVHKHVTNQARLTEVLVNSLGQGFLFFTKGGRCGEVYSQACLDLLEAIPAGKHITEVLKIPQSQRDDFKDWIDVLFQADHALGFDDVIHFFPKFFPHSHDRRIALDFKPIYKRGKDLAQVVMIATDQTEEYAARQAAARQQNFAEMVCKIFKDRNQFQSTLMHIREFLDIASRPDVTMKDSSRLQRQVHTLKASVKQFNLIEFGEIMHTVENELRDPFLKTEGDFQARLLKGRERIADALRRVTFEVSSLIGMDYEWRGHVREIGEDDLYEFAIHMQETQVAPSIIHDYLHNIAAVPIFDCFHSFDREMRELASMMEKQVKPLKFSGSNPRVLTKPIQELLFSFTHICRNIVDHGIEAPVTRMARGKDAAGQVTVACDIIENVPDMGKALEIIISDDGNGIDPSRVRAKLSSMDPEGPWRLEDDHAVIQRIFTWNFTTAEEVTMLSGRGIGMEAVELEVKKLGGRIHVSSQLYKGTAFTIHIPCDIEVNRVLEAFRREKESRKEARERIEFR